MSHYPYHTPQPQSYSGSHPYQQQIQRPPGSHPYQPYSYAHNGQQQYSYPSYQPAYNPGMPPYQSMPQVYPNFPPPSYDQPDLSHQFLSSQGTHSPVNLITNPNFEATVWNENGDTLEMSTEPWNILKTGGDGWRLEKTPQGSKPDKCPIEAGPSAHCVVGSYSWCKRSQIIDLSSKGYSSFVMDKQKPPIKVSEWFIARSDCSSEYYMEVTLLDQQKNPLDSFNSGTCSADSSQWQKVEHVFHNYPSGVRFIDFEDGSKDKSFWKGYYGAKMCQPNVEIEVEMQTPSATGSSLQYYGRPSLYADKVPEANIVNLIKNPSFSPLKWMGNVALEIDFQPWNIEDNREGYVLEKKPEGTKDSSYPTELSAFDVWCVATSASFSQRSQVIDLVQDGFSPEVLDVERPPIKIYEWFRSRKDCHGKYFLRVALLDQNKREIPGLKYDASSSQAPVDHWVKEEYTFMNIPPGVRYVEFRDGGSDCRHLAGYYGVKMVGAFVGVVSNSRTTASAPSSISSAQSPISSVQSPISSAISSISSAPRDPVTPKFQNLLVNEGLKPCHGWNENTCSDIDFSPWEIIENGGDGVELEQNPNGTETGPYPSRVVQNQHCIATSHGWFKRRQIIDLAQNGIFPHMYKSPNFEIYICEWFASRIDNEGEYYLKVALLDESKREIPGYEFDSGKNRAYSDEWEKVEYTFFPVPDTVRYVRFEDGGKDTKVWAGRYGVKMFGASVFAGEREEGKGEECIVM